MKEEDVGRDVVVIISETETVRGKITEIGDGTFRLVNSYGNEYQFAEAKVTVIFKGEAYAKQ